MIFGNPMPADTSCQAEYEDGFILDETAHGDVSAYVACPLVDGIPTGPNIFSDILNKRPEKQHGKMVRFSVFYKDRQYNVDWHGLPENARPIRARDRKRSINFDSGEQKTWWSGMRFGYQYNDEYGNNVKELREL